MELYECLSKYVGKWITPPRNESFNILAQRYILTIKNDEENYIDLRFESGNPIRLHYWRFNHVVDLIEQTHGEYIPIGSSLNPQHNDNIEGSLFKEAKDNKHRYANLRTAPFICDLIVLCGFAEYGNTVNPRTRRKVQGIRKKSY